MEKMKVLFVTIGSVLSSFFGILFVPILIMVACNTFDFATGMCAAHFRGEEITSRVFYRGIVKKVCMWILVAVGVLIDETIKYSIEQFGIVLPFTFLIACIVSVWIICNEILSILENLTAIGIPMPGFLKKLVKHLQQQTEGKVVIPDETGDEEGSEEDGESKGI